MKCCIKGSNIEWNIENWWKRKKEDREEEEINQEKEEKPGYGDKWRRRRRNKREEEECYDMMMRREKREIGESVKRKWFLFIFGLFNSTYDFSLYKYSFGGRTMLEEFNLTGWVKPRGGIKEARVSSLANWNRRKCIFLYKPRGWATGSIFTVTVCWWITCFLFMKSCKGL